ncbi:MAG: hypothetical protein DRI44_01380 [Chlamydiae bacterium]|nr:MAG: hypothetical protein DRI44_01380 [Chlamydiota bacterium]
MKNLFVLFFAATFLCSCANRNFVVCNSQNSSIVNFDSLLNELTDLNLLAETPAHKYSYRQASSYDRRSTNPYDKTDTNWFANGDIGHFIRTENINGTNEYVMMDAAGPGAVVRIWSANPGGTIKIYFDGNKKPGIKMPMKEILNGKNALFTNPVCHITARGYNCYMPLPYAKHCKITTTQKATYYHVDYRIYELGTEVETFSLKNAEENISDIKAVVDKLSKPETLTGNIVINNMVNFSADVAPDNIYQYVSDKNNSGKIYSFLCKVSATNIVDALRNCQLQIFFDDEEKSSVNAPLGDFFATAPGLNKFKSLPLGILDDGVMYCHWVMPFKKRFTIRITNYSDNPLTLSGNIIYSKEKWNDKTRYFHANWTSISNQPTRPFFDWTILKCYGQGDLVGTMIQIYNPVHKWWGEGDEKIFVDGEYFPSIFGTGSEDYFGYAWGDQTIFSHAFHNQTRADGPEYLGNTCNSRFQIIDNVPFEKSMKFNMEVWTHTSTTVSMASTVYWYAKPGAECEDNY